MDEKRNQKPLKPISNNKFNLALGLFLILIASVLVVDVGYSARTINFVLYFCFGFGIYVVLGLILIKGFMCLFSNKKIKIPHKAWLFSGLGVALLGVVSLITLITTNNQLFTLKDFIGKYSSLFSNYYEGIHAPFVYLEGKSAIGGGFFGYLLTAISNSIFKSISISYAIAGVFIGLGAIICLIPYIIKLFKLIFKKQKEIKKEHEEEIKNYTANLTEDDLYIVKDQTKDIIKSASHVHEENELENKKIVANNEVIKEKVITTNDQHIEFANNTNTRLGGLVPAHFTPDGVNFESHQVNQNQTNIPSSRTVELVSKKELINNKEVKVEEKIINNPIKQDNSSLNNIPSFQTNLSSEKIDAPLSQNDNSSLINEEKHDEVLQNKKPEQIHLDFEESERISKIQEEENKRLAAIEPIFKEPKVVGEENIKPKPHKVKHEFVEPPMDLLNDYVNDEAEELNIRTAEQRQITVNEILATFGFSVDCCGYVIGPSVTRYLLEYKEKASAKQISGIVDDISIRIGGVKARFDPIVPGLPYSGLEIPNAVVTTVGLKELLNLLPPREEHPFAIGFGKNISGEAVWTDLKELPHMLVSGTTGSGKSVFMHSIIMQLILRNSPDDLRLLLIDPKMVELAKYKDMPHLVRPIIDDPQEAVMAIKKLAEEMDLRYKTFRESGGAVDIDEYNELCDDDPSLERMTHYVVVIDEYNDLVTHAKEIAEPIILLAGKARACGIHLIIITQKPTSDVVTGLIKSNLPTHVALLVGSPSDSVTIIGEGGAEKLLGKGDMLVQCSAVSKVGPVRLQSAFIKGKEIIKVVDFLKKSMTTDYIEEFMDLEDHSNDATDPMLYEAGCRGSNSKTDERYEEVKRIVMNEESCSISKIQREFGFGFSRAGKIFNKLVEEGILERPSGVKGSSNGSKVLIHSDAYYIKPDIGSDEVSETESMDEYLKNAEKKGGAY